MPEGGKDIRYCYCPGCDKLRPRNWYQRGRCEICGGECVNIEVKRTWKGYLMYILDAIAVVFIGVYLFAESLTGALGDLVKALGVAGVAIVIFVLIGGSLVFGYLDLKDTAEMAESRVEEIKRRQMMLDTQVSPPDLEPEDQILIDER